MAELIIEIGTEEIPARMLQKAANDIKQALSSFLKDSHLAFEELEASGAPRQIVITCNQVDLRQEDRKEWVFGPPVRISYDSEGNPTKALEGFLRKNPLIDRTKLVHKSQPKGDVVAAEIAIEGKTTQDLLATALPEILGKLHFAKNMRWGDNPTRFVRPIRNLLALLNGQVIPFSFGGMRADKYSFGHRVFGESGFEVTSIQQLHLLKSQNHIICDHQERKKLIADDMQQYVEQIGGRLVEDPKLLSEVADLVEVPHVVCGSFSADFLQIPREVLITSIREHQKSFCVEDANGKLMPYFLSIASVPNDHKGLVKKGNEWVLNARLWDAKFFWEADLKKDFKDLREKLHSLMFIQQVGSYYQKSVRLGTLVSWMATKLGWSQSHTEQVVRAAHFAKADLVSDLVFEFPELQGQAGGLLLQEKGEHEQVWRAVYDHYLPYGMDGDLPETESGALVALADKLDTLVGCFAANLIPTGSKDPYALRRAAQGIVQIIVDKSFALPLNELLAQAIANFASDLDLPANLANTLDAFFLDRIRYFLKLRKFDHDLIAGVVATDHQRIDQILPRTSAVQTQQGEPYFRSLALNLKRINNILADEQDQLPSFQTDLLEEKLEHQLWDAFCEVKPQIEQAAAKQDFNHAMEIMAQLAEPINAYFDTDGVFINTEVVAVRLNRKSMLNLIRQTYGLVADISCLAPKV